MYTKFTDGIAHLLVETVDIGKVKILGTWKVSLVVYLKFQPVILSKNGNAGL